MTIAGGIHPRLSGSHLIDFKVIDFCFCLTSFWFNGSRSFGLSVGGGLSDVSFRTWVAIRFGFMSGFILNWLELQASKFLLGKPDTGSTGSRGAWVSFGMI